MERDRQGPQETRSSGLSSRWQRSDRHREDRTLYRRRPSVDSGRSGGLLGERDYDDRGLERRKSIGRRRRNSSESISSITSIAAEDHWQSRRRGRFQDDSSQSPGPSRQSRRNDQVDLREDDKRSKHGRRRHRSRSDTRRRRGRSASPQPAGKRSLAPLPSQKSAFREESGGDELAELIEKEKPNFEVSGKLAAETNTVMGTGIVLKYNEPPEARKPPTMQTWKLFVFKRKEVLDQIELYARSCWLFGRERAVADYVTEHGSCSKQHAVIQFRFRETRNEFGDRSGSVKPYIIDLESANGTRVNSKRIPERRFVELLSGDVVNFGDSTRDYVLMLP